MWAWNSGFLGNSGLSVSALSFGTMTIGGRDRFAKMGNLGVDETVAHPRHPAATPASRRSTPPTSIRSAAPRRFSAQALKGRRDEFVLVTKAFMRMSPGAARHRLSRKYLIAACEASLRRLQTDYLDLYICHQPDMFVPLEETLRAYEDLVDRRQGPLHRLLEPFGVAGDEGAGGVGSDRRAALHLPAGELLAGGARRRARDRAARAWIRRSA